jgi:putative transposase
MLCAAAGMSRQNYYKQRRARAKLSIDEELVLSLVAQQRSRHPRIGARKLLYLIAPELKEAEVSIGRDRFFALLDRHDLLIERKVGCRTTHSRHGFKIYPNLAKDLVVNGPHQLWVSDITYIRTLEGFLYLSLIMDAHSRVIVGYDCSDSLEMQGALWALAMALRQLPASSCPMHHSDRGVQYCCGAYIEQLQNAELAISMTQENHCYENAKAERLNGVLKQEYGLGGTIASKAVALELVTQAVESYNHFRPHGALQNRNPMQVHLAA